METKRRFVKIGFLIGLGVSLTVFLPCWTRVAESYYSTKVFYYEAYLFWQQCKAEGKSDLQAAKERYQIIQSRWGHPTEGLQTDKEREHPEAFIKGVLGKEEWDGFGYGRKPGRLETYFEMHTIWNTILFMAMLWWIPFIAVVVSPFLGAIIGYTLEKRRYSKSERS